MCCNFSDNVLLASHNALQGNHSVLWNLQETSHMGHNVLRQRVVDIFATHCQISTMHYEILECIARSHNMLWFSQQQHITTIMLWGSLYCQP